MKALVIINVSHQLLPSQVERLDATFGPGNWKRLDVPEAGWPRKKQERLASLLCCRTLVFASPVPLLLARSAAIRVHLDPAMAFWGLWVFHNDTRVAKEVPDGKGGVKVIHTVANTGWELIAI